MTFISCFQDYVTCHSGDFPMVSTILRIPHFEKPITIAFSFFSFTVLQRMYRALFHIMSPYFTQKMNLVLAYIGALTCFLLPLIGIFDSRHYRIQHTIVAISYFSFQTFYFVLFAKLSIKLEKLKDIEEVKNFSKMSNALIFLYVSTIATMAFLNTRHFVTSFFEWSFLMLALLLFCQLSSFIEDFYELIIN